MAERKYLSDYAKRRSLVNKRYEQTLIKFMDLGLAKKTREVRTRRSLKTNPTEFLKNLLNTPGKHEPVKDLIAEELERRGE